MNVSMNQGNNFHDWKGHADHLLIIHLGLLGIKPLATANFIYILCFEIFSVIFSSLFAILLDSQSDFMGNGFVL